MSLSEELTRRSKEICEMNGCSEEEHNCKSYAYIDKDMGLLDVCASDFFQGTSKPYAAIALPWTGTQEELEEEVAEQCWEMREG